MADASSPRRTPANANKTAKIVPQDETAEAPNATPTPVADVTPPVTTIAPPPTRRRRRSIKRPVLFALLPIALVVGGYYYVTGGQVMSTDNAYVQADTVGISPNVPGTVIAIEVHENETVKAGQVLFRLDPKAYRIALEGAQAQLGAARAQIVTLQASYKQSLALIAQAEADIPYYQKAFDRQQNLINSSVASQAAYDEAKHNLDAYLQKVAVAKTQAATTLAELGTDIDAPVEQNPIFLQAKAAVDDAQRKYDDTIVQAPFDGVVTNVSSLQIGSYLSAAQAGFSLVSDKNLWVSASPKETELTYVRPDQDVSITIDSYPGVVWKGKVASISPASGSSFSLLPAQNTTGNWVKVVQRIPMRVSIEDAQGKPPLRVGMSAVVDVETGHARGLPDSIQHLVDRFSGKGHE